MSGRGRTGAVLNSAQLAALATVVLDTTAVAGAAAANATAIQNALNAASLIPNGGTVRLYTATASSPALISSKLILPDYVTLDAGNVEIKPYGAIGNLLVSAAYAATPVSVTVTWSSGMTANVAYPSAHGLAVGEAISVARADQGQFNGVFIVDAVVDPLNVTVRLRRLPTTGPSGSTVARKANKCIRLKGGIWNYNKTGGNTGTGSDFHAVIVGHVWDAKATDMRFRDTLKYGICFGACAHLEWDNVGGEEIGSDCVKVYGPVFGILGNNLHVGNGGDDILSLQTREPAAYVAYDWTQGDVIGAVINGIQGRSRTAGFPLYASPAGVLDGIQINGLAVEASTTIYAMRIETLYASGTSEIGTVTVNDPVIGGQAHGFSFGNGANSILINKLLVNNVTFRSASNTGRLLYALGTSVTANVVIRGGYATGLENIINASNNTGTITLAIEGLHVGTSWQPVRMGTSGTLYVSLRDSVFDNNPGSALISMAAGTAVMYLQSSNTKLATAPTISIGAGASLRLSGPCDIPLDGFLLDPVIANHAQTATFNNTNPLFQSGVGTYTRGATSWLSSVARQRQSRFPRWKAALAARAAGTRNARLMIVADSLGVGLFSNGSNYANTKASGWVSKLAALFASQGIPLNLGCVFGDCSNTAAPATLVSVDPRLSLGANWTLGAFYTLGGGVVSNATAGSQTLYSFTPTEVFDTIEVTYVTNPAYGKFAIAVDGGAAIGAAVDCSPALSVLQTTRTCTRGTHRVDIFRSAATGADGTIAIVSVRVWDSTTRTVDILNASVGGATTALQSDTSAVYKPLSVGPIYSPDLTIIALDINDWIGGVTPGTYDLATTTTHSFQLQKIITAYKATGDVVLMTGAPSNTGSYTQAAQDLILTATRNLAAVNNIPLIDISAEWGNYAAGLAAGYYSPTNDAVHPGATGHTDIAARVASLAEFFGAA